MMIFGDRVKHVSGVMVTIGFINHNAEIWGVRRRWSLHGVSPSCPVDVVGLADIGFVVNEAHTLRLYEREMYLREFHEMLYAVRHSARIAMGKAPLPYIGHNEMIAHLVLARGLRP